MVKGVVLAGGTSRRMGSDKALLKVGGENLVTRALRCLAQVCDEVVVAAGPSRPLPGYDCVEEGSGRGPAAGILGAAAHFEESDLLVLACDLPAVPPALLRYLVDLGKGVEGVFPRWSRGIEPLCAFYRRGALEHLASRVAEGKFSLWQIHTEIRVEYLEGEALRSIGRPEQLFHNLNHRSDFELWLEDNK